MPTQPTPQPIQPDLANVAPVNPALPPDALLRSDAGVPSPQVGAPKPPVAATTGAISPYALAELRLGKRIDWDKVPNRVTVVEGALGMSFDKLIDPTSSSPVYAHLATDPATRRLVPDPHSPLNTAPTLLDGLKVVLSKLPAPQVNVNALPALQSPAIQPQQGVLGDGDLPQVGAQPGGAGTHWVDPGYFFYDAAMPSDVIQGALGDCYFIAALASVAWAHPHVIAQHTRATDAGQSFSRGVDVINLFNGDTKAPSRVEVSEMLPLQAPSDAYIYARSLNGEIWPAVYEKAYAKWRTHDAGDRPNYAPIAYGDPVRALVELTGTNATYFGTGDSAFAIWQNIRAHSFGHRTFDPMVAWTDCSNPAPAKYKGTGIVPCHAYSILGWDYVNNTMYVILRNPWGYYEATQNFEAGTYYGWNQSYWQSYTLSMHGVFGLTAAAFKNLFVGYGTVTGRINLPEY